MRAVKQYLFFVAALGLSATAAHAFGHGAIGPVVIESVNTIPLTYSDPANPALFHRPGDMEVIIQGGFTLPAGVTCDRQVITTLRSADPDQAMFQTLLAAVTHKQSVILGISDEPQFNAFQGRCSLLFVQIIKQP